MFHYGGCKDVPKIKPKNHSTFTGTRDEVISNGYKACGHCRPWLLAQCWHQQCGLFCVDTNKPLFRKTLHCWLCVLYSFILNFLIKKRPAHRMLTDLVLWAYYNGIRILMSRKRNLLKSGFTRNNQKLTRRFELPTSSLPMKCSTPELCQRIRACSKTLQRP